MEPNGYKAIWVRWLDSAGESGWVGRGDGLSQRVVEVYHLGFLIQDDERQITLSPTTYVDGGDATCPYHSPVAIPKVAILERGEINIVPSEPAVGLTFGPAITARAAQERANFAADFAAQRAEES